MLDTIPPFVFVIDTESYAGNFERQLCAYTTGRVGECEVGEEEAGEFNRENPGPNPFEEIIVNVPDEDGCWQPVAMWKTPGWFIDGMGGHFRDGDTNAAKEHHRESCLEESRRKPYASDESNREHEARWKKMAEEELIKYPAYQSVAIFFEEEPTEAVVAIMKKRVTDFCKREGIILTGFRILELRLEVKEKASVKTGRRE